MRSLTRTLVDRFTNRSEAGWNHTTYNKAAPAGYQSQHSKGTAELEIYGKVSTLFACVSKISNSAGSVKWRLYRTKTDQRRVTAGPKAEDNTEIISHVALDIWNSPNPFYTGSRFVEAVQQHCDLSGEQRWLISRNPLSDMPLELWPIRPDRIIPVPDRDEFLKGYVYTSPDGEKIPLEVNEVVSVLMPNPMDPYRGLGPVQSLMTDLEAHRAAGMYNRNFFLNDATPGGIIEMDTRLSDGEWREFNERWRESHQGVSNAHRVAMIENGGKWKDTGYTMRDMQFTELRKVSTDMILEAFAMSPHMLGKEDTVNRATAEAAEDVFARWVLKPRLDRIKDALNHQLLPLFGSSGQGLEFDFDDPGLEDSEANNNALVAKSTAAKTLIDAGFDKTSVLEAVGLPDIEVDALKEKQAKKALEAPTVQPGGLPGQPVGVPGKNGQKAPEKEPVPA